MCSYYRNKIQGNYDSPCAIGWETWRRLHRICSFPLLWLNLSFFLLNFLEIQETIHQWWLINQLEQNIGPWPMQLVNWSSSEACWRIWMSFMKELLGFTMIKWQLYILHLIQFIMNELNTLGQIVILFVGRRGQVLSWLLHVLTHHQRAY